ncbi:MAG: FAD-binding oxidoreductase [Syntrophaceae bacterium]|nr:FAD-binding oxidoreductase [Syntrophaceae bacterium]
MRRWNGWGDDTEGYTLPGSALKFLHKTIGPGAPPRDASLEDVLRRVPPSRLPPHPFVSTDPEDRLRHARGQSLPDWIALRSGRIDSFPDGIARPFNAEDVRNLLDFAKRNRVRLIPYGGGTSVAGHVNPLPGEEPVLTVDLSRMNRLLLFDERSHQAVFEAGVAGPDLEAQLRSRGYTLGHFPQSFEYSTLGGWIATRSSGQQSLGYGRIERLFAGGRMETPSGTLELPPFPASAAGPDLREAVLGSEGRFGILTEAVVRVTSIPRTEEFHALFFPDFDRGGEAARRMLWSGIPLSMLRLSTARETETTLALAGHEFLIGALERYLSVRGAAKHKCMLLFAVSGGAQISRTARREALEIAAGCGGIPAGKTFGREWHRNRFRMPYLRNTLWEAGYAVDTLETAVPWSSIPGMIREIERALGEALAETGEKVHFFTHLSHLYPWGSSLYTTCLFRLAEEPEESLLRWRRLKDGASRAIVAQGGTISHQHGVGVDHAPYLPAEKGALGMAVLGDLCRRFDPSGIMNPGKLTG